MKLIKEQSSLILKDNNYTGFFGGLVFTVIGGGIVFFALSAKTINLILGGFGAIFLLAGLWMLATTKLISVTLDKGIGKMSYSTKGIIGSSSGDYPLSRIKGIKLEKFMSGGGRKSTPKWHFILNFVLDDDNVLPFEFGSVDINLMDPMMGGQKKIYEEAQTIADFLQVPLQKVEPQMHAYPLDLSEINEIVRSGKSGISFKPVDIVKKIE